jgi:tetratricopeptide (TPR) repeat protein
VAPVFVTLGAAAQPADTTGRIPLRVQLEGLAPGPRIAYLRYLIDEGAGDPEVYFQLGVAYHESDEADSAIRYYRAAAEIDPDYSKAYVNIGVLYDEQGKSAQALEMYEEGIRVDPDDVLAHAHAAFIRFLFKDYANAWDHLSRALEIDPDDPQARFYLAIFFWECRMYREALMEWERVVDIDPDGFLASKARENIILLQKALNAPSRSGEWEPKR